MDLPHFKESQLSPKTRRILLGHHLTDAGNAESFSVLYGSSFCHVPERGKWFRWDGVRWAEDNESPSLAMLETVRAKEKIAMGLSNNERRTNILKWCLSSESAFRIRAALSLAESMLKVSLTEFDRDPFLLCCANGVVDLRTGVFRESTPEDRLSRCTNIKYDADAECPRWLDFLSQVFNEDDELINFIQLAIGYSLTGDISEQCLFINFGEGGNGRSTLFGTVESMLGDYAATTPSSTFKEHKWGDSIPNDIARLAGTRFVKCIEVKETITLNEERVKSITGGDRIPARFLHREFFEYIPNFKLWVVVNRKPIIRGTDEGIWRRIKLIPYQISFHGDRRDPYMQDTLLKELPGILNWSIEGCLEWQRERLGTPEVVRNETEEYRKESDIIGNFLRERTTRSQGKKVRASDLYSAYREWCRDNSESPVTGTAFGREMTRLGFQKIPKPYVHYKDLQLVMTTFPFTR